MRIALPEDFSEDNVAVTANTLFIHFANDLSSFIANFMVNKYGVAWLQDLRLSNVNYRSFNPKDPAALLKDLARNGSSSLRIALHSKIERGFLKDYYDDLDDLLGERNAWLHRQVQETKSELLELIGALMRVGKPLGLKIVEDCLELQQAILVPAPAQIPLPIVESPPVPEVNVLLEVPPSVRPILETDSESTPIPQQSTEVEETPSQNLGISTEIGSMLNGESFHIGDVISDPLLSHSYVLHVNGDIRDRSSDLLLASVNPTSGPVLSALLIARKPSGGRIRITAEGILCAFFGDKWGYLALVKPQDWFPNHISSDPDSIEET